MNNFFWFVISTIAITGCTKIKNQETTKNLSTENVYQTQNLFTNKNLSHNTFTLITSDNQSSCYLIDQNGEKVNEWIQKDRLKIKYCKLLSNGQLIRAINVDHPAFSKHKNAHGKLELVNWDGTVQWSMTYADKNHIMHNDIVAVEQGDGSFTFLVHAWDKVYANKSPNKESYILKEILLEIKPLEKNKYEIVCDWIM